MKKIITMLIISVFILSLFGIVFAQQEQAGKQGTPALTAASDAGAKGVAAETSGADVKGCVERCREQGEDDKCIARCRAAEAAKEKAALLKANKFVSLNEAQKTKLQRLSTARLQKLEKLSERQIQKINTLTASKIKKITALSEAKLRKISSLDEEKLKKLALLTKRKIQSYSELKEDQLNVKLDKLKIKRIKIEEKFVKRQLTKARIGELNTNYNLAKEKYTKAKGLYKDNKQKFLAVKKRVRECGDNDSEECQNLQEEALANAKEYSKGVVDTLIEHLNKIRNRIESSETLSEEASAKALEEIDSLITELGEIKEKIDAAETKEELKETIKELNRLALKVRKRAKIRAAGLLHDGVARLIKLAELSGEKVECSISQLGEEVDTAEIDGLMDEYYGKIEAAEEDFEKAKELLLSGTETAVKDAHAKIKDARANVKEAHKLMLEIRKKIRDLGGKPCQKAEVEVAEEEEEEESTTEAITEEVPLETEEEDEEETETEETEEEG